MKQQSIRQHKAEHQRRLICIKETIKLYYLQQNYKRRYIFNRLTILSV